MFVTKVFCPACGHTWDADCYLHEDDCANLQNRVARLEDALKEISTLYWVDAPAPEEMRRIARRVLEEK